jgi:hypothetical protein
MHETVLFLLARDGGQGRSTIDRQAGEQGGIPGLTTYYYPPYSVLCKKGSGRLGSIFLALPAQRLANRIAARKTRHDELVEASVPREAIVLGFRPEHLRQYSGFAVA